MDHLVLQQPIQNPRQGPATWQRELDAHAHGQPSQPNHPFVGQFKRATHTLSSANRTCKDVMQHSNPTELSSQPIIDVSIVIVTWNALELLRDCLDSVPAGAAGINYELCVVDNNSSDGTVAAIKAEYPCVRIIANTGDVGPAVGNNLGAKGARGRYLFLLNPDTKLYPGVIKALVDYADQHDDVGAVGPRLLNPDGSLQRSCWRNYPGIRMLLIDALYLWKIPWLPLTRYSEYTPGELTDIREVDHMQGAGLLIRRTLWERLAGFDEQYFMYLEETDWCLRAKQAGCRLVYYPKVEMMHYGQTSAHKEPSAGQTRLYRSYCLFYRKHTQTGQFGIALLKASIVLSSVVRIMLWKWRAFGARTPDAKREAGLRSLGYRRVLSEVSAY